MTTPERHATSNRNPASATPRQALQVAESAVSLGGVQDGCSA
jgi:hypothetical protein